MSNAAISFPAIGLTVNPTRVIFSAFGRNFYWYGAIIALAFLLAVIYVLYRSKDFGLEQERVIDMLLCAVPSAIIFARLYFVIFNFADYAENPLKILLVWEGGLAIYGGVIGAVLAVIIYSKVVKIPAGALLDLGGLGLLIGQAIGRWGNFINREAYGTITDLPWKMGLTNSSGTTIYVHPTFLYESLWNILGFALLHFFSKKRRKYDGQLFILYVAWYGLGRFFIEGLRTDSLYLWGTNIRASQLLAILSFIAALIILFCNRFLKHHEPEDMLVNKLKAEELMKGAVPAEGPQIEEDISEEEPGEMEDDIEYEPVIEPIEVVFHDEDGAEGDTEDATGGIVQDGEKREDGSDGGNS